MSNKQPITKEEFEECLQHLKCCVGKIDNTFIATYLSLDNVYRALELEAASYEDALLEAWVFHTT